VQIWIGDAREAARKAAARRHARPENLNRTWVVGHGRFDSLSTGRSWPRTSNSLRDSGEQRGARVGEVRCPFFFYLVLYLINFFVPTRP
jgi:hypothetical protein